MSAYIADAIRRREHEDSLVTLLDEMDARHGAPPIEDVRWARRALGLT
ncbi:MAG: hypothetical protein ACFCVF_11835 [Kineosporiaceae bacterium]